MESEGHQVLVLVLCTPIRGAELRYFTFLGRVGLR